MGCTLLCLTLTITRGSNGPVYPINRRGFFGCFPGPKDPGVAKKGVKKKTGITPLVGLMDPNTSKELGFFK